MRRARTRILHSLAEIAELLELTVPAVKAALHRGRVRLRARRVEVPPPAVPSPTLVRYVDLFAAHDWDGVRAMLAEDVRLDLVSHWQRFGRREVGTYFTNYARLGGWRLAAASLDGREVIAVFGDGPSPAYFVELEIVAGAIVSIRDFRFVPYIAAEAALVLFVASPPSAGPFERPPPRSHSIG